MSLLLYCKTPAAVLLVGVKDERGVLRFPTGGDPRQPGIRFEARPLVPINEQLVDAAAEALGVPRVELRGLDVSQEFADETTLPDGTLATVYLATLASGGPAAPASWPSLPEILRAMPKDRSRLPFMRAWQILAGGLQLQTKAVDLEEVRRHFDD